MSLTDIIEEKPGKLVQLRLWRFDGFALPSAVEFIWEKSDPIFLEVVDEDDTLRWVPNKTAGLIEMALPKALESFLNLSRGFCWEMWNQQGYVDAFQMELFNNATRKALQFESGASQISIYERQDIL
jgi:Family of unknown function (DUF6334)